MASTGNSAIVKLTGALRELLAVVREFREILTRTREAIERLHEALDTVRVADRTLKAFNAVLEAVKAACDALSGVPYVGPIFKAAGQIIDTLQKAVDKVSKVVSRVEGRVKPIREKLPKVIERLRKVEDLTARFEGLVEAELDHAVGTDAALAGAPRSRYRRVSEDEYARGATEIAPGLADHASVLAAGAKTLGGIDQSVGVLRRLITVVTKPIAPIARCTRELEERLPPIKVLQDTLGREVFMGLTVVEILNGGLSGFAIFVQKAGEKLVMRILRPLIERALPRPSVSPAMLLALPGTFLRIASVLEQMFATTTGLVPELEDTMSSRRQSGLFAAVAA